jgi:glycosyltransferase involved in cell wall biosynthesis
MIKTRILVANHFVSGANGIGVDAKNILGALAEKSEFEISYLFKKSIKHDLLVKINKFKLAYFGINKSIKTYGTDIFFQTQFGFGIPSERDTLWIVRVHDFFPLTNPDWFSKSSARYFRQSLKSAVLGGARFVFNSEYTQSEFLRIFPNSLNKSMVWYCSEQTFDDKPCGLCVGCQKINLFCGQRFFLSVGTLEPRKGYSELITSWEKLYKASPFSYPLVIIGKYGWKTRKVKWKLKHTTCSSIHWISSCCSGALNQYYDKAMVYISNSSNEGFNIPALEARNSAAIPLILRDLPVHREIHGQIAYFYSDLQNLLQLVTTVSKFERPQKFEPRQKVFLLHEFFRKHQI